MGVFSERIFALFLLVPRRPRGASDTLAKPRERAYGVPEEQSTSTSTWATGREYSPSSSVQRADLEALRAFCRMR